MSIPEQMIREVEKLWNDGFHRSEQKKDYEQLVRRISQTLKRMKDLNPTKSRDMKEKE